MVCDGRIGGSGYNPKTAPNLNLNQKGVDGLQQKLSKTDGHMVYAGTSGTKSIFQFRDKNGKYLGMENVMVRRDNTTGSVEYKYFINEDGKNVRVSAYDIDGDGNIDRFTKKDNRTINKTYVNNLDDGQDHFVEQKSQKTESHWYDPRTWF